MLRSHNTLFPTSKENMTHDAPTDQKNTNVLENNPFYDNITPYLKQTGTHRSFYSRVNTTPVKVKNDSEELNSMFSQNETTVDRKHPFLEPKSSAISRATNIFLPQFDAKENDFFSPNMNSLSTSNTNRFTSNSNARNQVKYLISEGKGVESKPTLNMVESRNKLIAFSKSKKYEKGQNDYKKVAIQEEIKDNSESTTLEKKAKVMSASTQPPAEEIKEESEEDFLAKKLKNQIANLHVPLNKKDDENFKLLKMKEMKKKSLPPNKSAKAYDADLVPAHQMDVINEHNYSLCKKRKSSHSAKKVYKSMLPFTNPRDPQEVHRFPLFRDKDIGINEYWQAHLIESKADEDILTDDEQLHIAHHFTLNEIGEAFDIFEKEGVSCLRNKGFLNFSDGQNYNGEEI